MTKQSKEIEQLKQEISTLKQEHENGISMMLQWKQKYGAEVSLSSQMQVIAMQAEARIKELEGQIEPLNKKKDK